MCVNKNDKMFRKIVKIYKKLKKIKKFCQIYEVKDTIYITIKLIKYGIKL
jgi:hypothetical protein